MSHTAFSLCYAPVKSSQYNTNDEYSINDSTLSSIQTTCNNIMALRGSCHISIATTSLPDPTATFPNAMKVPLVDTPTDYNITVTGPHDTVMAARTDLLQNCPLTIQLDMKIPMNDLPSIFTDPTCHTAIFEKVKSETHAQISLVLPGPKQQQASYFESENVLKLCIVGLPHHAELARIRLLVALDELMNLHSDILRIPRKLHYLICGRKRATLQPIVDETLINIYFPPPFPTFDTTTIPATDGDDDTSDDEPPIFITGDAANVSRVKEMLTKLANQKAKSMYHKDTNLDARKLDWMQLHRRDELCQIMHDNGSFISLPPLGSKMNSVTVYAENRVNAERTLRSINFLACYIYEACFYFHDQDGLYADANFFNSISNLATLTTTLSQVSGAEVAYRTDPGCIQVFGTERAVRNVYQRLHETTFLKIFHQDTVFNVELSNDQREFISGKKNGKINKIMKTSGAKIKFLPFGEYNFILEVESTNFIKALDGLTLLQEELPAEISFYVPETYHKRIIGVGGKNIQRIMKKYGVYVKFSNAEEFASLGGYYGNEDNVVARTPMKNQINLDNLRHAVMDLITPKDKDFVLQQLSIPFRRHRTLLCDYRTYLQEVSKKTSVKIIWPNHELANDVVTLVGPQSNLDSATQMVRQMVSDVYRFCVPMSTQLVSVLSSTAFKEQVIQRLQHEMNIAVDVDSIVANATASTTTTTTTTAGTKATNNESVKSGNQQHPTTAQASASSPIAASPLSPTSNNGNEPEDSVLNSCTIPLTLNKTNLDHLPFALDILVCHLREHHVPLYKESASDIPDNNARSNSNNSVTANYSHHFGNKLLSSVIPPDLPSPPAVLPSHHPSVGSSMNGFPSYSLFDYPPTNGGNMLNAPWKNFRDNSNIRAIFDSPYDANDQDPRSGCLTGPTSPTQPPGYLNGYSNHGGLVSHSTPTSSNNLDIWLNPYGGFQNGFSAVTSPPLTSIGSNGLGDPSQNLLYGGNEPAFYFHGYTPMMGVNTLGQRHTSANTPSGEYPGMYIQPTSSTSSGSNNSLNSTKSMPESSIDLRHRSFQARSSQPQDDPTTIAATSTLSPPLSVAKTFRHDATSIASVGRNGGTPPSHLRSSRSSSIVPQHHHQNNSDHHQQQHYQQQQRRQFHQQQQQQQQAPSPPLAYPSSTMTSFPMSPSSSSATNQSPLPSSASTPMIPMSSTTASSSNIIGNNTMPRAFGETLDKKGTALEYSSFYSPIEESNIDSLLSKISLGSSDQENTMGSAFDQYQHHHQRRT